VSRLVVGFAGSFSVHFADRVRSYLEVPAEVALADEATILGRLPELDVLVALAFTPEMGAAASRLRLLQTPGAGVDRIDQSVLPRGAWLANAYGHETGIAEYVMGAMLVAARAFGRLDRELRRGSWAGSWAWSAPPWPELRGRTVGILGYGRIGQTVAQRAPCLRDDGPRSSTLPPGRRAGGGARISTSADPTRWTKCSRWPTTWSSASRSPPPPTDCWTPALWG